MSSSELNKSLADAITKATAGVGNAIDWLAVQIPDVIHQLLLWKAIESAVWFVFYLIGAISSSVLVVWLLKQMNKCRTQGLYNLYWSETDDYNPLGNKGRPSIISLILIVPALYYAPSCINDMMNTLDWLKIWIAPKVYLIDFSHQLYQSVKAGK